MKQGVTTLLGGISKALVVEPDDNYQMAKIIGGEAVIFDRFKVCCVLYDRIFLEN
jgi:hypothetical protein